MCALLTAPHQQGGAQLRHYERAATQAAHVTSGFLRRGVRALRSYTASVSPAWRQQEPRSRVLRSIQSRKKP